MDQQIAIRRAAAALVEMDDALRPIVPVGHSLDMWRLTSERLREELLKAWLWETIELVGESTSHRVSVDELWAAWAHLWGLEPSDKQAGGYPRRVFTQVVSEMPGPSGAVLGERVSKRAGGKVVRFWLGFRMKPRGSA